MKVITGKTNGLLVQVINFLGEGKIFFGNGVAGVVGGKTKLNGAIADVDIGMMIGGLGQLADLHDQRQRLDKIGAPDGAGQGVARLGPTLGNALRH